MIPISLEIRKKERFQELEHAFIIHVDVKGVI
jgi:hypothetical protein